MASIWKPIPGAPGYEFDGARVRKAASRHLIGRTNATRIRIWIGGVCLVVSKEHIREAVATGQPADEVSEVKEQEGQIKPVLPPGFAPGAPVYIDQDEPDFVVMRTCTSCRRRVPESEMDGGKCPKCSEGASAPAMKPHGRKCRTCGKPLPPEYYFHHPECRSRRSNHAFEIHGVPV